MAVPALLYGSEVWITTSKQVQRINTAEMRFLRNIVGYSLLEYRRNEDIHNELKVENIIDKLTTFRVNWYNHITRIENTRYPYKTMHYKYYSLYI